jgi:ABC-type lipoprotein release transport system permease subunit
MNLLLKLGLRNIGRNRMRSFLTITAVVLCSGGLLLYSTLFSGMIDMMLGAMINQTGHARFIHKQLLAKPRLGRGVYFVDKADELAAKARKIKNVKAAVVRIQLGGFVEHDKSQYIKDKEKRFQASKLDKNRKQAPAPGIGIDPAAERPIWDLHTKILKGGRMMKPKGREVVLGFDLAKRLQAKVGAKIVLLGKTVDDSMSAVKLKVVGIAGTGMGIYDKMFYINLPTARYMLDIGKKATYVQVFANALWQSDALNVELNKLKLPATVTVQDWKKTPMAAYMVPVAKIMLYILGGIVVFIGGIGLLNTMMMSVLERKDEVGVMMALGFTPAKVAGVFLTEGVVFGVVGGLLGVGLGLLGSIPLVTTGITFGTDAVSKMPFPISSTIKGAITMEGIIVGLTVGILTTLLGTLYPAWKASQMPPVDALRN